MPVLSYDSLPPGSDIRIEHDGDTIRILVPAGEPPRAAIRQAALESLASGAANSWALLLLAIVIFYFGIRANRISGPALLWAWSFFAIFCAAIVALVSWVRYGVALDALRHGRQQMTVIIATGARLLIETVGPFGFASHDVPRDSIAHLRSVTEGLPDALQRVWRVRHLSISLRDARRILLLPARDSRELHWILSTLSTTPPSRTRPGPLQAGPEGPDAFSSQRDGA